MFGEIAKMNGGSLTVGDLTEGHSRVSIPYRLGQVDFPNIASSDVSVVLMDSMRAIQDW